MTTSLPVADVTNKTVTAGDTKYEIQVLDADQATVVLGGLPVGRIVYTFGAANGVPEKDSTVDEDTLYAIAEAWFAATAG